MTPIARTLTYADGRFELTFDPRSDFQAKAIGGAKKNNVRRWPATYVAAVQILATFRNVSISDSAADCIEYLREVRLIGLSVKEKTTPVLLAAGELADLQTVGANWLVFSRSAILADEMGSGKTVMACAALEAIAANRVAIACPNSVKRVWQDHLKEWTGIRPIVIEGDKKKRQQQFAAAEDYPGRVAVILGWQQLSLCGKLKKFGNLKMSDEDKRLKELDLTRWDVLIADEAHRAKNPKAKQTRALWNIDADRRWLLTGTPIANHPGDIWSLLHCLDPAAWPSRVSFIDRYCDVRWNPWGGDIVGLKEETAEEFHHLIEPLFLRRRKSEIIGHMIGKNHSVRYVRLAGDHRRQYEQFRDELLVKIEGGHLLADSPLTLTTRLVQLCSSPLRYDEATNAHVMVGPSPKVTELMALLDDLGDAPLVVYSSSKQLLKLAEDAVNEAGIKYVILTGDTPQDVRAAFIERFQDGGCRVFLATTGAAADGITLTRARHMCILQRSWSMVQNLQAEDRIHRWGQTAGAVEYISIITEGTLDEPIHQLYADKQGKLNEITRDDLKELLE